MIDLRNALAGAIGAPLSDDNLEELTQVVYAELESRVGEKISGLFSAPALLAFEEAIDADDDEMSARILEAECPQYRDIVATDVERLVAEVRDRLRPEADRQAGH